MKAFDYLKDLYYRFVWHRRDIVIQNRWLVVYKDGSGRNMIAPIYEDDWIEHIAIAQKSAEQCWISKSREVKK